MCEQYEKDQAKPTRRGQKQRKKNGYKFKCNKSMYQVRYKIKLKNKNKSSPLASTEHSQVPSTDLKQKQNHFGNEYY